MKTGDLRAIETFVKAIELGSIRRAASAQGITPQAASHALVGLEKKLGVRLLHRTTRSLALTTEGEEYLVIVQPALAALARANERIRSVKEEVAGPLKIIAPKYSFLSVLWPLVDEFCHRYPRIEPDIRLDDMIGDWVEDRVDVGFRVGQPPNDGLITRRLFPMQLIVCAAPSYLMKQGIPDSIEALSTHRCTVFRHPHTGRIVPWLFKTDNNVISVDMPPSLSSNDAELETQAVLSGHFIGLLSGLSAAAPIREGKLVPLLTDFVADHMNVHVYYGSRIAQPSRVRAFIDLTIERLANSSHYVLTQDELAVAEQKGRIKYKGA